MSLAITTGPSDLLIDAYGQCADHSPCSRRGTVEMLYIVREHDSHNQ